MPFFLPADFLLLEALAVEPELPPAFALALAQRARAAAAMRSRPAAERPPRRFRVFRAVLAGAEVAELGELLGALEPLKILLSRLCSWSICRLTATASSSCLTDTSMRSYKPRTR